jgi:hypothetical protein
VSPATRALACARQLLFPVPFWAWLAAALWCGLGIDYGLQIYDEGMLLVGARSVANGGVPVRDFWTAYPPGVFWLLGLAFQIFGEQMIVNRLLHVVVTVGVCIAAAHVLRHLLGPGRGVLFGFLVLALYIGGMRLPAGYPPPLCLLLAFWSLVELLGTGSVPASGRVWRAGFAAGLCAIVRYDMALYLVAASAGGAGLALLRLADFASRQRAAIRAAGAYAAGMAGPVVLAYGVLVGLAGIGPVYDSLVEFPLRVFPRVRDLPLDRPFEFLFTTAARDWQAVWFVRDSTLTLPYIGIAVAAAGAARAWLRRRHETAPLLFGLSLLALAFVNQYRVRSGQVHAWPLVVAALVVATPLIGWTLGSTARLARVTGAIAVALGLAILAPDMIRRGSVLLSARYLTPTKAVDSRWAAGIRIDATDSMTNPLLVHLREHAAGEPYIFSGTIDHDQLMFNDALIYFLAGKLSPTPYPDLVPGVIDTPDVQREVVDALGRHDVRTVVLFHHVSVEPNESSHNKRVDILDRALADQFRPSGSIPPFYTVLRRIGP